MSSQELYESGRFQEVVGQVASAPEATTPRDLWFAARSYLELRQIEEGRRLFERLSATGDGGWRAASRLALATLAGSAPEIDAARAEGGGYPAHAFVQFELGLAHMNRGALREAAEALDRSSAAEPTLAHAYYYAGLAYQKLDRTDLMADRFETFLRLAPDAPQRPEVQAVMNTIRG
jgi:tetratricopeptide (TPR) repeat protein